MGGVEVQAPMGQSVAGMPSFGFASRKVEDSIFSAGSIT